MLLRHVSTVFCSPQRSEDYFLTDDHACCFRDQSDELQQQKLLYADLQREMEILRTRSEVIAMLNTEVHHLGRQILQVSLWMQ